MNRNCDTCNTEYSAKHPSSRFCSPKCRQRSHRSPGLYLAAVPRKSVESTLEASALESATLAELRTAGRESSALGIASLILARSIDSEVPQTGSSLAALVKEQRAALEAALVGSMGALDVLDDLVRQRQERIRRQAHQPMRTE